MELTRSVLLPYTAEDMFDLVEQAEHYPQFVPWCTGVAIHERTADTVAARIDFSYLRIAFGFSTRNPKQRPRSLQVRLVEGPFRHFRGDWTFTPLGDLGCKVQFVVSFQVADGALNRIAAPAVDWVAGAMVEAFVSRAQQTLTLAGQPRPPGAAPLAPGAPVPGTPPPRPPSPRPS